MTLPAPADPFAAQRHAMVEQQLRGRGITDKRVLLLMDLLPRHAFVPAALANAAYEDEALPVGEGQTISQPYMVAFMTQALRVEARHRVLEVGTGTGYQTALLASLLSAGKVFTIERVPELAAAARARLTAMGYTNIEYAVGDGSLGWPAEMVFDRILVTAGAPEQDPGPLLGQLAETGILLIPQGPRAQQTLYAFTRADGAVHRQALLACRFVPLVGAGAWREGTG